ncbi:MAG: C25 family cysteine peptidase, partial [candidate division WOR-3 bacterium]
MRFRIIFLFLFFFVIKIFGQQIVESLKNGYLIKFEAQSEVALESYDNGIKKLDFIYAVDESKPGFPKLPSKLIYISIPPNSRLSVTIENINYHDIQNVLVGTNPLVKLKDDTVLVYENVNFQETLYDDTFYPKDEIELIGYTWIRDFYVATIKINTHRYSINSRVLRIIDSALIKVSFESNSSDYQLNTTPLSIYDEMLKEIIINFDDALKFRSFNPNLVAQDTTGTWIDYSKEYIKLAIPADNIYRITYNDLISYGLNPALINPKTFKLFVRGKEHPIFVFGEEDNSFDANDYIEFYAERNYSYQNYRQIVNVGQDYINYMNRYNDTTIVWLTWDGAFGKRLSIVSENNLATPDTIKSHLVKIHLERDAIFWYYDPVVPRVQLPFWQENKVFTWLSIGNSGSTSATFTARDFLPNTQVQIIARLISYASSGSTNAHSHGLSLNKTTPQDTIVYNYKQTVNFIGNYSSSQLITGTNTIRVFGLPSQATFHQSFIDWFDVEYYRSNIAINDTLLINIPDSVTTQLRAIRIDNISNPNNLIIYKTKPGFKKFVNFITTGSGPFSVLIVDTVSGGDQYFITSILKVSRPLLKDKKYFVNLRNSSRGADYIIITNKILQNSSNQYKSFIEANYNLRVALVFDHDIYDEFSFGMLEAEAIRSFLVSAYRNWLPPKPTFLTLIGDANYDYKDIITPAPTPRKKNVLTSFGNPVSDVWYVMWDTVNIHFPQMYVGRIPANNDDQVLMYLQKHQKYLQRKFDYFNKSYLF